MSGERTSRLRIGVLGPLVATGPDGDADVGSPKQRAVLALLALEPGRPVTLDRLVFELWGDDVPRAAANTVQTYMSRIRRALGAGALAKRSGGYVLDVPPSAVDAVRFEELAHGGRDRLEEGDAEGAATTLREAVALWRGRAFEDTSDVPSCEREAARLDELRVQAFEDLLDAELRSGRHVDVLAHTARLIAEHPLRERFYALRMLALYRADRQADALACYQELRSVLDDELGIEPSEETRKLEHDILRQSADLIHTVEPAEATRVVPARHVPVAATSFVGRADEAREIAELWQSARHITLTGTGGSGKTRLALSVADGEAEAWFVALHDVSEAEAVAAHVARTLGVDVPSGTDPRSVLSDVFREADGLLVLDNCEHVLDVAAALAGELLAATRLRILATSREPLRTSGEHVVRVAPLPVPAPDEDDPLATAAVQLFIERARAVSPAFDGSLHADAIVEVVRRLDGIPLAIELAAARTDVLTPKEIAARLDDALALLSDAPRTDDPRRRTLRATLQWTYDALTPDQQRLLRGLSVFTGGWTVATAEELTSAPTVIDDLARLVALGLIDDRGADGDEKRFDMLHTTRMFAAEQLVAHGAENEARHVHLRSMHALAASVQPELAGPGQPSAAARVDRELANLTTALTFALTDGGDANAGMSVAVALVPYWQVRGQLADARRWLERALELAPDHPSATAAHIGAGVACQLLGDWDAAADHYAHARRAATSAGDERAAARALLNLGNLAVFRNQLAEARSMLSDAVTAGRTIGDLDLETRAMTSLAVVVQRSGDADAARELYVDALDNASELGDPVIEGTLLLNLGDLDRQRGDHDAARDRLTQAIEHAERIDHVAALAAAHGASGNLAQDAGDLVEARAHFERSVELAQKMGNVGLEWAGSTSLAGVLLDLGDLDGASRLFKRARRHYERGGDRRGEGRAVRGLADVMRAQGDHRTAARHLRTALEIAAELGLADDVSAALSSADALAAEVGPADGTIDADGSADDRVAPVIAWLASLSRKQ